MQLSSIIIELILFDSLVFHITLSLDTTKGHPETSLRATAIVICCFAFRSADAIQQPAFDWLHKDENDSLF